MCGILGVIGKSNINKYFHLALQTLYHRGPDVQGMWSSPSGECLFGHRRLSIIDLSNNAKQPMHDPEGRYHIIYNGEIYNYPELRKELIADWDFISMSDTEVLLAAYKKWGVNCLDKLIGMFAFAIWDEHTDSLFVARDRFGVKPLYYATLSSGELVLASEIKTLHKLGVSREPDPKTWSTYLNYGLYDNTNRTFWKGIKALPPGCYLRWNDGHIHFQKWYDLANSVGNKMSFSDEKEVIDECLAIMEDSVRIRFRSDVPVGISLSGGLDSSMLLALVHKVQGMESDVSAFTYITGDDRYDELPWVKQLIDQTLHPHRVCLLKPYEVPDLAKKVFMYQDEPFGGIPTLAYSKVFERARKEGVTVILDGQGLDEQWAGYDYYGNALSDTSLEVDIDRGLVQGSRSNPVRPECLLREFSKLSEKFIAPSCFPDDLRNLQYRDTCYTKIPKAVRFSDRISMMHSIELRSPFLDHRLFELAFTQPVERKIRDGIHKWLPRQIAGSLFPKSLVNARKRPVQTPQREWIKYDLREWVDTCISDALLHFGGTWLDRKAVMKEWDNYREGNSDNSFYIFQWISLGLLCQVDSI